MQIAWINGMNALWAFPGVSTPQNRTYRADESISLFLGFTIVLDKLSDSLNVWFSFSISVRLECKSQPPLSPLSGGQVSTPQNRTYRARGLDGYFFSSSGFGFSGVMFTMSCSALRALQATRVFRIWCANPICFVISVWFSTWKRRCFW